MAKEATILLVIYNLIYSKEYAYTAAVLLRGNCTPNQKLACFVLQLKIINTFWKNNICISYPIIVQGTEKWI